MSLVFDFDQDVADLYRELQTVAAMTKSALGAIDDHKLHRLAEYQPNIDRIQRLIGRVQLLNEAMKEKGQEG